MEDAGSHVGQDAILHLRILIRGHVDEGNGVRGMCRVGRAVGIDGMVGIAVVGGDDGFVAHRLGRFHNLVQTLVDGLHGGLDGGIDACVTHHVGVGEVHHDPVVLVGLQGLDKFVLHLEGRHLGLQVVGSHLGRGNQDALFARERLLTPAVDEGCDVGIFLGLGDVQLLQSHAGDVFAEGILQVVLGEEDMYAREAVVVGRHAVVLQVGDVRHALLRHVLLREHRGQLLGAVAAEVEEDDHVALP